VSWPEDAPAWMQALVSDPQTSGGLLVSCAPDAVDAVLAAFAQQGFAQAQVLGSLVEPGPGALAGLRFR